MKLSLFHFNVYSYMSDSTLEPWSVIHALNIIYNMTVISLITFIKLCKTTACFMRFPVLIYLLYLVTFVILSPIFTIFG